MLLIDPRNPRSRELGDRIAPIIENQNMPFALVIGGDGWMLDCIRAHGAKHVYLGLNAGTLGFLMNDPCDINDTLNEILSGLYKIHHFPRLHIEGILSNGDAFQSYAVNDVYVARQLGRAANLRLLIDGVEVVEKLICDGLVVATSLGSTAYSSSAGGSPSHPLINAFHVTPICPHSPRLRSFVVPQNTHIEIETLYPNRRPVQAVSDGVSHGEAQHLKIKCDKETIQIAFLEGHNFTENMNDKVLNV